MAELKKTIPIKGMHCASCVRLIERSLSKVEGVKDCSVNLANETATITYENVSDSQIKSAVESVGYKAILDDQVYNHEAEKDKELSKLKVKVFASLAVGAVILF